MKHVFYFGRGLFRAAACVVVVVAMPLWVPLMAIYNWGSVD